MLLLLQRHMVDTNQCKMAYEDNEDEYEDFYDYGGEDEEGDADMEGGGGQGRALILSEAEAGPAAAYELVLAGGGGGRGGGKILGSREFARYYRQRLRLGDLRASVQAAVVQAQYRKLAVPLLVRGGGGVRVGGGEKAVVVKAVGGGKRSMSLLHTLRWRGFTPLQFTYF